MVSQGLLCISAFDLLFTHTMAMESKQPMSSPPGICTLLYIAPGFKIQGATSPGNVPQQCSALQLSLLKGVN